MKFTLEAFESLPSTNQYLLDQPGSIQGRAILALNQSAGVGRRGRSWFFSRGALAFSLGIELEENQKKILSWLPIWLGVTTYDLVASKIPDAEPLSLKWPNDIYFNTKKLAGILAQVRSNGHRTRVALGIGLNLIEAPETMGYALGLMDCGAEPIGPIQFAQELIDRLNQKTIEPLDELMDEWESRCHHLKKDVLFGDPAEEIHTWEQGLAVGLNDSAGLRVKLVNGNEKILIGEEISLRW